jgi:hypothetical protein
MQSDRLRVTLFTASLEADDVPFEVDYVSLYNGGTHGPPALVAPGREKGENVPTRASLGDSVLYINTSLVPAFEIERYRA